MKLLLVPALLLANLVSASAEPADEELKLKFPKKEHLTARQLYEMGHPPAVKDKVIGQLLLLDVTVKIARKVPLVEIEMPEGLAKDPGRNVLRAHVETTSDEAETWKAGDRFRIEGIVVQEGFGAYFIRLLGCKRSTEPAATAKQAPEPLKNEKPESHGNAEDANRRVEEFEQARWKELKIFPQHSKEQEALRDSKEFQDKIRAFFASLDDSESRIAALGMLNHRYAYLMNLPLRAELLGPLIRDSDPKLKRAAVGAVSSNLATKLYAKELMAMLEDDAYLDILPSLASVFGAVEDEALRKKVAARLEKLMASTDDKIRVAGLDAMIRFSAAPAWKKTPDKPWPWLLPLLDDPHVRVRGDAIHALTPLGANGVELAIRMLDDKEPFVRERALHALLKMNDSKACGAPHSAQKPEEKDAKKHGDMACPLPPQLCAKSCDAIAGRLTDSDPDVRLSAARALGYLHETRYAGAVAALLQEKNGRQYVAEALGTMDDPSQIEKLRPFLKNDDQRVRESAAKAIELLSAKNARGESIEALAEIVRQLEEAHAMQAKILDQFEETRKRLAILLQNPEVPDVERENQEMTFKAQLRAMEAQLADLNAHRAALEAKAAAIKANAEAMKKGANPPEAGR